ncbi:flagellar hook-basal body protein [Aneurinibacillus sp. Ricciae_BoGa-3]|uniref:flagellar hook-basal body protein n=1 Tax=Aneurinibacillus sp. Ricciae_BoGa-3 TaxID=3022697 RepID=UPI0023412671|nr:flagellar hook-basal body protein [Aneurinibacillus sp. Ricciae_BoGa-3]WCK54315.1 flagellar hook-basal body protein [Aneurinibacillus sp. Ricciae_BoGa-3]
MLRGIDTAAAGMIANQARQEALTNNLANVNTPGYKADNSVYRTFPEVLLDRINDTSTVQGRPAIPGQPQRVGALAQGVYTQELVPSFTQGDIVETNKPLDFSLADQGLAPAYVNADGTPAQAVNGQPPQGAHAVQPKVFFAVRKQGDNGQAEISYTRNGNFTMSPNGLLTTPEGYPVLAANGQPVNIQQLLGGRPLDSRNLQMSDTGQLYVQGSPAAPVQLALVQVTNPDQSLAKEADTTFRFTGQGQPPALTSGIVPGISVKQGYIEKSNVDAGRTMIDMMSVMRSYEANQKVLAAYDSTLQKLNDVGRV